MPTEFPEIAVRGEWDRLLKKKAKGSLEGVLPAFLTQRRWFGGKNRQIREVEIREAVPVTYGTATAYVVWLHVQYVETDPEVYVLPLAVAYEHEAERLLEELPHAVVARLKCDRPAVLYDAMWDPGFCSAILAAMARGDTLPGTHGRLAAVGLATLAEEVGNTPAEPTLSKAEQSNTSIVFGDRYIMKVFRRLENGANPDLEIGRYLTETRQFANSPSVVGFVEYRRQQGEPMTLGLLQRFVPNQGTGWSYTLDNLDRYVERVLTGSVGMESPPEYNASVADIARIEPSATVSQIIGPYLESARQLGQRTAEMHLALATEQADPAFHPEPFSPAYQSSLYQSMRSEANRVFQTLAMRCKVLPVGPQESARRVLEAQGDVLSRFQAVTSTPMTGQRCRVHGDYHLGQVLYTGKDFVIIDFEGEPSRSLTDRRIKRSVLSDVAGMIRSFHYAAYTALLGRGADRSGGQSARRPEDFDQLEEWCQYWYASVAATFLRAYRETAGEAAFIPDSHFEFKILTEAFVLSKAVYELGYELGHRPDWVSVPLLGILDILKTPQAWPAGADRSLRE
jgi:maltose alpha-D-glucosyltransferase / alpha-amylase